MIRNVVLSVTFTLVVTAICACGAGDRALPLRKDCIVKIALEWPEKVTVQEREDVIAKVGIAMSLAATKLGQDYTINLAVPKSNRNAIYIQFKRNCSAREQMARRIVSHVKETVLSSPPMFLVPAVVEPGPDTIDTWGPSWADRPD